MTLLRGHMFLQLLQSLKNPPDSEGDSAYPMVEVRIDQQFVSMCEGFFCNQKVYNGNDIFSFTCSPLISLTLFSLKYKSELCR